MHRPVPHGALTPRFGTRAVERVAGRGVPPAARRIDAEDVPVLGHAFGRRPSSAESSEAYDSCSQDDVAGFGEPASKLPRRDAQPDSLAAPPAHVS